MQISAPIRTLGQFVLRFAALLALTLAVLASVSVSASKNTNAPSPTAQNPVARDTAQDVNSRRYPLSDRSI